MRSPLRPMEGRQVHVICRVDRFVYINQQGDKRAIVTSVHDYHNGDFYSDHIWLSWKDELSAANPKGGDIISFSATVEYYLRGNLEWDYGLRKLSVVEVNPEHPYYATWERRVKSKSREKVKPCESRKHPKLRTTSRGRSTKLPLDFGVYIEEAD